MEKTSENTGIWGKVGFFLNSSVLILALTVFAYIIPYYYQKGYKSYFHIPGEFIELTLPQLFSPNMKVLLLDAVFFLFLSCL